MTPRVRHFITRVPEPESFHWFDLGWLPRHSVDLVVDAQMERLITHLPFPRCALVFADADGREAMLALYEGATSVTAAGIVDAGGGRYVPIEALAYIVAEDGIRIARPPGVETTQDRRLQSMAILSVLHRFLRALDADGSTCWQPQSRGGFLNAKRAAKGKPPAAWSWRTVRIDPSVDAEREAMGQPTGRRLRAHDRRGHWRRLGEDRLVWVRACRVGDASMGASMHDYRVGVST